MKWCLNDRQFSGGSSSFPVVPKGVFRALWWISSLPCSSHGVVGMQAGGRAGAESGRRRDHSLPGRNLLGKMPVKENREEAWRALESRQTIVQVWPQGRKNWSLDRSDLDCNAILRKFGKAFCGKSAVCPTDRPASVSLLCLVATGAALGSMELGPWSVALLR